MRVLFTVGRLIGGSLYTPRQRVDNKNQPMLDKEGKPMLQFNFGVAIPKKGEQHWSQTEWGKLVWSEGASAYDTMAQAPAFAWKITDGDSVIPDKNGRAPNSKPHYPGNWVIWFSQGWAPRIVNPIDNRDIIEENAVVPGYFVQVLADVVANGTKQQPSQSPGVYMNPLAVAFIGYGERIVSETVDLTGVTFNTSEQLPGMTATPPAAYNPPAAMPTPPPAPGMPTPPPAPGMPTPPPAPGMPQPNYAVLQPAQPVKTMTPAAGGNSYEQMISAGWTDDLLIAAGMMVVK